MNEVKAEKLPILASYTCSFIWKLLQGAKIWMLFSQLYKNPTDFFVLEVSTVVRVDFKIRMCTASQEK